MTAARVHAGRVVAGWSRRSARERLLLGGLAAGLAAYGFAVMVVQPLVAARATARASIAQYDAALDRLSAAPAGAVASDEPASPLPTVLTETAPEFGLTIRRLESDGGGVQVLLEDADFASVVMWIEELETAHAIRVVTADMDRAQAPGVVTARLGLSQ